MVADATLHSLDSIAIMLGGAFGFVPNLLFLLLLFVKTKEQQLSFPMTIVRSTFMLNTFICTLYFLTFVNFLPFLSSLAPFLAYCYEVVLLARFQLQIVLLVTIWIMAIQIRSDYSRLMIHRHVLRSSLLIGALITCAVSLVPFIHKAYGGGSYPFNWLSGTLSVQVAFGIAPTVAFFVVASLLVFSVDRSVSATQEDARRRYGMQVSAKDRHLLELVSLHKHVRRHFFSSIVSMSPLVFIHVCVLLRNTHTSLRGVLWALQFTGTLLLSCNSFMSVLSYITAPEVISRIEVVARWFGKDGTRAEIYVHGATTVYEKFTRTPRIVTLLLAAFMLPIWSTAACVMVIFALFPVLVLQDTSKTLGRNFTLVLVWAHSLYLVWTVIYVFLTDYGMRAAIPYGIAISLVVVVAIFVATVATAVATKDPVRVTIRSPSFTARLTFWNLFTVVQLVLEVLQLTAFPVLASDVWAEWLHVFFRIVMLQFQYQISFIIGMAIVSLWLFLVSLPRTIELLTSRRRYSGWLRRNPIIHVVLEMLSNPLYYIVMRVIFSSWKCSGGHLDSDTSIACLSDTHTKYLSLSLFAFAVYFPTTTLSPTGTDPDRFNKSLDLRTMPLFSMAKNITVAVISAANAVSSELCMWASCGGSLVLLALNIWLQPSNIFSTNLFRSIIYLLGAISSVITLLSHYTSILLPDVKTPISLVLQILLPAIYVTLPVVAILVHAFTEPRRRIAPPSMDAVTFEKEREAREAMNELSKFANTKSDTTLRTRSNSDLESARPVNVAFQSARRTLRDPEVIASAIVKPMVRNRVYIERLYRHIVVETPFQLQAMAALTRTADVRKDSSGLLAHKVALTSVVELLPAIVENRTWEMALASSELLDKLATHDILHLIVVKQGAIRAIGAFLSHGGPIHIRIHATTALGRLISKDIDVLLHAHREELPKLVIQNIDTEAIKKGADIPGIMEVPSSAALPKADSPASPQASTPQTRSAGTIKGTMSGKATPRSLEVPMTIPELEPSTIMSQSTDDSAVYDTEYDDGYDSYDEFESSSSIDPTRGSMPTLNIPVVTVRSVTTERRDSLNTAPKLTPRFNTARLPTLNNIPSSASLSGSSGSDYDETLDTAETTLAFELAVRSVHCLGELAKHGDDLDWNSAGSESPLWSLIDDNCIVDVVLEYAAATCRALREASVFLLAQLLSCVSGREIVLQEGDTLVASLLSAASVIDKKDYDFFPIQRSFCMCLSGAATADNSLGVALATARSDRISYLVVLFCASPAVTVQLAAVAAVTSLAKCSDRVVSSLVSVGALDTLSMLLSGENGRVRELASDALIAIHSHGSVAVRRSMAARGVVDRLREEHILDGSLFTTSFEDDCDLR
ncbi:hypothetical protein J8273_6842 [Carpediemonas membranifera]|uniref:Uncharacterized protein n=1 Tax=Carpediemonas membranifera TaxID=201153 RepID=A0A8J6AR78_9EUKA|nr:hypothetical protein J8273_6842 [Carpediemonas membranifera]|eukprot:KAG9391888.1 hypothetical protein J8273_6842 [Carpediemonas membranifera]